MFVSQRLNYCWVHVISVHAGQLSRQARRTSPAHFSPITGLAPTVLVGGSYRYNYSPTNNTSEFFRIEGL
jgi:hypothetical protein